MVDPQANVYIVSKVDDGRGVVFQLPSSAWGTGQKVQISSTALIHAPSTHHDPVGGDISPNGKEVLIKVFQPEHNVRPMAEWRSTGVCVYVCVCVRVRVCVCVCVCVCENGGFAFSCLLGSMGLLYHNKYYIL